jgi:uncharacterized protein DUF4003
MADIRSARPTSASAAANRRRAEAIVRDIRVRQLEGSKRPAAIVDRFTRVILASLPVSIAADALERAAIALRTSAGARSPLGGRYRYGFAAMILARGLEPRDVIGRVTNVRAAFRRWNIGRGGSREVVAALLLVLRAGRHPVTSATLDRMRDLLASWRKKHWLVTGPDDFPMAALHASRDEELDALDERIEAIYRALAASGFRRGNQLQLASHLLAVAPWPAADAAARFAALAKAFTGKGMAIRLGQYDECAILSLASGEAREVAQAVAMEKSRVMRTEKLSGTIAFCVAVGEFLAAQARERVDLRDADDLEMLAAARQAVGRRNLSSTATIVGIGVLLAFGFAFGVPGAAAPLVLAATKKGTNDKPWRPAATRGARPRPREGPEAPGATPPRRSSPPLP